MSAWQIKVDGFGYPSIHDTDEDGNPGDLIAHTFADHEHLICSAPELLAALEGAHKALRKYEWYDNPKSGWALPENEHLRGLVEAAIAQATGAA
jgi:hypothetical protein